MEEDASVPKEASAFFRLPRNVIENILYAADANSFASLALLNRQWRVISECSSLYAHHLSQCPSFDWTGEAVPTPGDAGSLQNLRRHFIGEIRRNAFDVFLRPRRTLVRLISSSMSSSTSFPQGEVFRFSFSANGQMVLCITSSRIVVLEVTTDPVTVKHELKTRRRPLGAAIHDNGSLLAVLSSTHRVNVYRLSGDEVKHIQTIMLNDVPYDLTFSPTGSVLALSFENNIEVFAVGEEALSTERRAARCPRVDRLAFSPDGLMLLGSPLDCAEGGIVTITAQFYTEPGIDASPEEVQMRMWTTQILFPEIARCFTHACLIGGHEEADDNWVLGYDRKLLAFRAIKIDNINAGSVYFASPFLAEESREMLPIMLPTTDDVGELAAFGFQDSGVWIYGVPKRLDIASLSSHNKSHEAARRPLGGIHHYDEQSVPRDNLAQLEKIVQHSSVLIRGRRVADMHGTTSARWVKPTGSQDPRRRLVVVAPGGVHPQVLGNEDVPVDGGRVLLLDFERSTTNGDETHLDIELGETTPKMLVEPDSSMDTEVELARRRTRLRRPDTDSTLTQPSSRPPLRGSQRATSQALLPHLRRNSLTVQTSGDGVSSDAFLDIPYDNTQPRSGETLQRAATAAASTRGRYDLRYRNSPSRRLVPHESDADNWAPPPPPYSREPDRPLPDHLRQNLLLNVSASTHIPGNTSAQPVRRAQTTRVTPSISPDSPRPQSVILQRLNTITNFRQPGRRRRSSTAAGQDSSPEPVTGLATTAAQMDQQNLNMSQNAAVNTWSAAPDTTATPIDPVTTSYLESAQPLPIVAIHAAENHTQQSAMTMPSLGPPMSAESYHPYSVSSPSLLHIPQPHGNALDVSAEDDAQIPGRQRSFCRRVSTEPPNLPPPENEAWRRRIEDWNEHTIRERNRRRWNKCIVM